jgi:hypothetical protein
LPQQLGAEPVKRTQPNPRPRHQLSHPTLHLVGRLIGERQREYLRRRDTILDQISDPMGNDTRLPATWPRKDQQRPIMMRDSLSLRFSK